MRNIFKLWPLEHKNYFIIMEENMKKTFKFAILIVLISSIFACEKKDSYSKKSALEFFKSKGHIISNSNETELNTVVLSKKNTYSLNDNWQFYDDNFEVKKVNETDFFITYTMRFNNKEDWNTFYHIEEQYFSTPAVYNDPVPLKITETRIDVDRNNANTVRERYLWQGDFAGYLERHKKISSIVPKTNHNNGNK